MLLQDSDVQEGAGGVRGVVLVALSTNAALFQHRAQSRGMLGRNVLT